MLTGLVQRLQWAGVCGGVPAGVGSLAAGHRGGAAVRECSLERLKWVGSRGEGCRSADGGHFLPGAPHLGDGVWQRPDAAAGTPPAEAPAHGENTFALVQCTALKCLACSSLHTNFTKATCDNYIGGHGCHDFHTHTTYQKGPLLCWSAHFMVQQNCKYY